jgi:NADPH:quinone reductase-like Zn-dependent oxidoreductase
MTETFHDDSSLTKTSPAGAAGMMRLFLVNFVLPIFYNHAEVVNGNTLVCRLISASAAAEFDMVKKGAIKILTSQRYRLADVAKAHGDLEGGRTRGSSILVP